MDKEKFKDAMKEYNTWTTDNEKSILSNILKDSQIVEVDNGSFIIELQLTQDHMNSFDTLHGGCSATFIDIISMLALRTQNVKGVSLGLNINYISTVKIRQRVIISGKVLKSDQNIAFLSGEVREKSSNKLISQGHQTAHITAEKEVTEETNKNEQ